MNIGIAVGARGFRGGLERYAHDLASSLAARGHSPVLIHGDEPGRDFDAYAKAFTATRRLTEARCGAGLDVVYVQKARDPEELRAFGDVPVVLAAHDHDLTCARSHRYVPFGRTPCHRAPGVGCVLRGCALVRGSGRVPVRLVDPVRLGRRLLKLGQGRHIVACSRYVAARLTDAGLDPRRVHAIHPIPPFEPRPIASRPAAPVLAVVAQLVTGKGVDLAIDALAHLPTDVRLVVAGDGPSRGALEAQARRRAPGRVDFTGYLRPDAIDGVYDRARVVVVPSRWPEPFGMVGIEALRRGRPVVAARHGGIVEWLSDDRATAGFEPGDVSSLARAVRRLLAAPDDVVHDATRAAAGFEHDESVEALLSVFREALADHAGSRNDADRPFLRVG